MSWSAYLSKVKQKHRRCMLNRYLYSSEWLWRPASTWSWRDASPLTRGDSDLSTVFVCLHAHRSLKYQDAIIIRVSVRLKSSCDRPSFKTITLLFLARAYQKLKIIAVFAPRSTFYVRLRRRADGTLYHRREAPWGVDGFRAHTRRCRSNSCEISNTNVQCVQA